MHKRGAHTKCSTKCLNSKVLLGSKTTCVGRGWESWLAEDSTKGEPMAGLNPYLFMLLGDGPNVVRRGCDPPAELRFRASRTEIGFPHQKCSPQGMNSRTRTRNISFFFSSDPCFHSVLFPKKWDWLWSTETVSSIFLLSFRGRRPNST